MRELKSLNAFELLFCKFFCEATGVFSLLSQEGVMSLKYVDPTTAVVVY